MHKEALLKYINTHSLIGIKAGNDRTAFLEIWMVVVDNRMFARSWGMAEKSWYNSFLQDPLGQIKCGETIYSIKANIPADNYILKDKINEAYLNKYNSAHNAKYAKGITQEPHISKTMEFIICES
ncbi:MAG: DUF2255 family protein [Bacteroidia bacterium]|nr:DUF2255 family protein [Bacteroidia bacterium]HQV01195.1 DUF2255 family protein [Bacteroidia bacterium]